MTRRASTALSAQMAERMAGGTPQAAALGLRFVSVEPGAAVMEVALARGPGRRPGHRGHRRRGGHHPARPHLRPGRVVAAVAAERRAPPPPWTCASTTCAPPRRGRDVIAEAHCYKLTRSDRASCAPRPGTSTRTTGRHRPGGLRRSNRPRPTAPPDERPAPSSSRPSCSACPTSGSWACGPSWPATR